jgi:hypothetical protein
MRGARLRLAALVVAAVTFAACAGGGSATTKPGEDGGGSPAPGATSASGTSATGSGQAGGGQTTGGGRATAGDISKIDTCSLLTPKEIEAAVGSPMQDGHKANHSGNTAGCEWMPQQESAGLEVDVTITPFDQDLWNRETTVTGIEAVPGVGDAAFRGFVTAQLLLIKQDGMEVDLAVIAPLLPIQKVKDAQVPLAKTLLSRL